MIEPLTFEQLKELVTIIGGGFITIVLILAIFTSFFDNMFKKRNEN